MCVIHRVTKSGVIAYVAPAGYTPSTNELDSTEFTDTIPVADMKKAAPQAATAPKPAPKRRTNAHRQYYNAAGAGSQCSHARGRTRKPKAR